jgi:alkylhydroperoxidase family enzyme
MGGNTRQVLTLAQSWRDLPLTPAERAMLAYVELLALNPNRATKGDVERGGKPASPTRRSSRS